MVNLRVFILFSLGFFISYLFRGVNLALAPDLATALSLTASDLGFLTSLYFVTFAGFQIPLGMLLDRFGPRKVDAGLLVLAALGSLLFGLAQNKGMLIAGRLLIGLGVSACLMAALKAMVMWFPKERLPSLNGGVFAIGGLGAVAAATPVELALGVTDWRGVFMGLAALTLAMAAAIFIGVPERRAAQPDTDLRAQLRGVRTVLGSRLFRRVAPLTMISQGAFMAVQGLWAGPFLRDVANADRLAAANAVALIGFGMVLGYWLSGVGARWLAERGVALLTTAGAGMLGFMAIQILILCRVPAPDWLLWSVYGFFGGSGVVSYATLNSAFPPHMAGRVSTALTLTMFAAAFFFQMSIGVVVGWWPASTAGSYAAEGHRTAWIIMLAMQFAAFAWYCIPASTSSRIASVRSGSPLEEEASRP